MRFFVSRNMDNFSDETHIGGIGGKTVLFKKSNKQFRNTSTLVEASKAKIVVILEEHGLKPMIMALPIYSLFQVPSSSYLGDLSA